MSDDGTPDIEAVKRLVARLHPVLAGNAPETVGAALADALAMLLAGHFCGGRAETDALREELLSGHIDIVRRLIPENEKLLLDRTRRGGH